MDFGILQEAVLCRVIGNLGRFEIYQNDVVKILANSSFQVQIFSKQAHLVSSYLHKESSLKLTMPYSAVALAHFKLDGPRGLQAAFLKNVKNQARLCKQLKDSYSKKHQDNWMQVRWSFVQPIVIQSEIAQGGKIILKLIGFTFSTESSRSLS